MTEENERSEGRPEVLAAMATLLQPVNIHAGERISRTWTVAEWLRDMFLPLGRRKWKLSASSTTGDRIRKHLITDLGSLDIRSVTRELLQRYLEQNAAAGCSFSLVDHLRWDLRAIFRLAAQDRLLPSNPAEMLFTPRTLATPSRRVLTPKQVQQILHILPLADQV